MADSPQDDTKEGTDDGLRNKALKSSATRTSTSEREKKGGAKK